jgi:signal transduction histidine kinase
MSAMSAIPQLKLKSEALRDLSKSEAQLRDAHRMEAIGRLVGGVAHDFNNLLTGMVLCSELILAGLDEGSRLRRFAEDIRKAGEQGAGLIQQLMAVARQRTVEPQLLCLHDAVCEVHNLLTRLIGENIELVSDLSADLGLVKMDPAQVQQIILNLVLNARDAMPDGGQISLQTRNSPGPGTVGDDQKRECDNWVMFSVSDTGCGMDAETRARLFEPFFTTKKPGKGNGLGLSTVHRIVTEEHGTIEIESETGHGTRVVVNLPRVDLGSQLAIPNVSTEVSANQNKNKERRVTSGRGKSV